LDNYLAIILYFYGNYQISFAFLLIPAILTLSVLVASRVLYPHPHDLEINVPKIQTKGLMKVYWIYITAVVFIALGFVDFPLVAYHFQKVEIISPVMIPIFYSVAMGVDALAALLFGRLFDKIGMWSLITAVLLSAFFAPLVFFGGFNLALLGMALWGVGMGAQESIMRAAVAEMSPVNVRGSAYGVFSTIYGLAWFIGSLSLGILYDVSITLMVIVSLSAQLFAVIPLLFIRNYNP